MYRYRPTFMKWGWMADDTGVWHAFALRAHWIVLGRPKFCRLERICDERLGRGRDRAPRLHHEPMPRESERACEACRVQLERLWALPEAPQEKAKRKPPGPGMA